MERELNIAAILKGKPSAKLWSPIIGDCIYSNYYPSTEEIVVSFTNRYGEEGEWNFHQSGRTLSARNTAEVCLFPSKQMQDWSKFAWKKGDVLKVATGSDCSCIFDRFTNDDYTEFTGVFDKYLDRFDSFATSDWCKVTDEKEYESIIQRIETQYGGKLNLDTLKIEKPQFKDGDIMYLKTIILHNEYLFIYNKNEHKKTGYYIGIALPSYTLLDTYNHPFVCDDGSVENLRLATDSEKQQLFSALEKEGKAWDAEKKQIVDLPKKCELKAFDKVLAKFDEDLEWMPDFFYYYDNTDNEMPYVCIANGRAIACIPYNDQTAHLLGTTDDWKGGEE